MLMKKEILVCGLIDIHLKKFDQVKKKHGKFFNHTDLLK